jgi:hypothetical protein
MQKGRQRAPLLSLYILRATGFVPGINAGTIVGMGENPVDIFRGDSIIHRWT